MNQRKQQRPARDFLADILGSIDEIEAFLAGVSQRDFCISMETRMQEKRKAVRCSIQDIGEAMKQVAKIDPSFTENHPGIPVSKIAKMRDKIAHGYFGVDWAIVWDTARNDLPPLREPIRRILAEFERQP